MGAESGVIGVVRWAGVHRRLLFIALAAALWGVVAYKAKPVWKADGPK